MKRWGIKQDLIVAYLLLLLAFFVPGIVGML